METPTPLAGKAETITFTRQVNAATNSLTTRVISSPRTATWSPSCMTGQPNTATSEPKRAIYVLRPASSTSTRRTLGRLLTVPELGVTGGEGLATAATRPMIVTRHRWTGDSQLASGRPPPSMS